MVRHSVVAWVLGAVVFANVGCGDTEEASPQPTDTGVETDGEVPKRGPVSFTSTPPVSASVETPYAYRAIAKQEGALASDTITYALAKKPDGMTIDAATGDVKWTPTAAQVGKHDVSIIATATDGQSSQQDYAVGVDAIVVGSISPAAGTAGGSETITIKGAHFSASLKVRFGDVDATSVKLVDESTLEVISPTHVAGTYPVSVIAGTAPADTFRPGFTFIPKIESTDTDKITTGSNLAVRAIGQSTTLGANVLSLPAPLGTFRRIAASSLETTSVVFAVGVGANEAKPATGAIRLLVNGIQSNCAPLAINDAVAPAALAITGTKASSTASQLVLEGSGFVGPAYDGVSAFDSANPTALLVMFTGAAKPARVVSIATDGGSAEVEVPSDAVTGPVRVYAPARAPATSCAIVVVGTTTPGLGVLSFTPEGGPIGSALVIDGSGFAADPKDIQVVVGSKAATVLSSSSSRVVVQIPDGVSAGPNQVRVTVAGKSVDGGLYAVTGTHKVIAGGGAPPSVTGDGGPATAASIDPRFLAIDSAGNYLLADGPRIRMVNRTTSPISAYGVTIAPGNIATVVDASKITGVLPSQAVGAIAVHPVTQDAYFSVGSRIYRGARADGAASAFAGTGTAGFSGDGGYRLNATFSGISDLRFTTKAPRAGALLLVADNNNGWVRVVNTTLSSISLWGITVGPELVQSIEQTAVANPMGLALDSDDNLFVSRLTDVVRIATDRPTRPSTPDSSYVKFTIVAGDSSFNPPSTGCPATSVPLGVNNGVAYDSARGHIFVGGRNGLVRRVASDCVALVAGKMPPSAPVAEIGYSGDGGNALQAAVGLFVRPFVDADGSVLIVADGRIRRVTFRSDTARSPDIITTVVGIGPKLPATGSSASSLTSIDGLGGVVVDAARNRYLYVSSSAVVAHDRTTNNVEVFAGNGVLGNTIGAGSLAKNVSLGALRGMTIHGGELVLLETVLPRVSAIDLASTLFRVVAGNGLSATVPEQEIAQPASSAKVAITTGAPKAVSGPDGALYFADADKVRVVNTTTAAVSSFGISVPAGGIDYVRGFFGSSLSGLAFDKSGNLYVATLDSRIFVKSSDASTSYRVDLLVTADGTRVGFNPARKVVNLRLNDPTDLLFTAAGDLLIANSMGNSVVFVKADPVGKITTDSEAITLFGSGAPGTPTDGSNAVTALGSVSSLGLDGKKLLVNAGSRLVTVDLP